MNRSIMRKEIDLEIKNFPTKKFQMVSLVYFTKHLKN